LTALGVPPLLACRMEVDAALRSLLVLGWRANVASFEGTISEAQICAPGCPRRIGLSSAVNMTIFKLRPVPLPNLV
jgi:hypothetical protein